MNPSQRPRSGQQARVSHHASNADSFAFFNLLTGPQLLDRVEAGLPVHRERKFPPTETLSMFLAQVLSADGSCQQALDDFLVKRVVAGLEPGSTDTGAYCKARARLPLSMVSTLARETGALVAGATPPWWLWRGRRVRLVDGTTMTLADTQENQAEYPQPASQKKGLGFPVLRLVVLLCLATGALIDAAMGPCAGKGSDEQSLFRELLDSLESGDVLVADAFYPTYFLLCELVRGGVDGVFEQFGARRRSTDFTRGERLGPNDHLIDLVKPKRPEWMSQWEYDRFPATLTVRELKAGGKILVTTFLDPKETPKRVVAALLRRGSWATPERSSSSCAAWSVRVRPVWAAWWMASIQPREPSGGPSAPLAARMALSQRMTLLVFFSATRPMTSRSMSRPTTRARRRPSS
jgi:hypothetical protein